MTIAPTTEKVTKRPRGISQESGRLATTPAKSAKYSNANHAGISKMSIKSFFIPLFNY